MTDAFEDPAAHAGHAAHAGRRVLFGTRLKTSTENFSRAVPRYLLLVTHISEIDRKNLVGPAGTKFRTYRRVDLVPGVHTGHPVF